MSRRGDRNGRRPAIQGRRPGTDLRRLPRTLARRVAAARRLARKTRVPLYLAGGAVRDLLLGRAIVDLDLVTEGEGIAFGRALARDLGVRVRIHERFGTASLEFTDGSRMDVASARVETYASPGSLPRVTAAAIRHDLARRDFTVNAMAVRLWPGTTVLVDPHGGARDLSQRKIRMLHPGSPHDDPTRAFRAVRYANRLGFSIEAGTRRWIREALESGAFEVVSGDRLRRELRLLFSERNRAGAIRTIRRLGLERAVESNLSAGPAVLTALRRAESIANRRPGRTGWLLFLLVWCGEADEPTLRRVADRLSLSGRERRIFLTWAANREKLLERGIPPAPSRVLASDLSADEIAAAAALASRATARALERTLASTQTRLSIRGRDLLAAGIPAGPRIGRALAVTLDAVRDGRISREEELRFAISAASPRTP